MARVLVAVIVYNGRDFVPRALRSISRLSATSAHNVDVLVLDDASPEPGFSDDIAALSASLGIDYYRGPRNVGIPRNMNLGLLRTLDGGYDACVLLNSDVVVPANLIDAMMNAARPPRVGSVTAWANDVSVFSLENHNAAAHLADQTLLDKVSAALDDEFDGATVDLPVGCGFCLLIPRHAIETVGLMDPVFGRGYAEEVDWCCRATERGLTHVLAPGAFAFHMGSATNKTSGILAKGMRTVVTNEAIVDLRHPWYRETLAAWTAANPLDAVRTRALTRLITDAARERGVVIDATWLERNSPPSTGLAHVAAEHDTTVIEPTGADRVVRVVVAPDGTEPIVEVRVDGWRLAVPVGPQGPLDTIAGLLGVLPSQIRLHDDGSVAGRLAVAAAAAAIDVTRRPSYPERV